jgi:indole-3-glycerol phosphate synthase
LETSTECFLDRVVQYKRKEVNDLRDIGSKRLQELAEAAPYPRDFLSSFRKLSSTPIIAEIKKAAPSWGTLRKEVDVGALAKTYQSHGAAAISVLTDLTFFGGCMNDLAVVRAEVTIPVLRKDFVISVEQLYQARAAGADASLLIVAALDDLQLTHLYNTSKELGMTPLLEVHDEDELNRALRLNPEIIGINNRNLKTLKVDLSVSEELRQQIPLDVTVVAESGVSCPADIKRLLDAGIDGFLVGTSLMKSSDPGMTLLSFVNTGRS